MQTEEEAETLVNENMKLAHFMAEKYLQSITTHTGVEDRDFALSAAMEGLWRSAQEFDPEKGIPFGSYASSRIKWWIQGSLRKYRSKKRIPAFARVSIDAEVGDGERTLKDIIPSEEEPENHDAERTSTHAIRAVSSLTPIQRRVIVMLYGLNGASPKTLEDVASVIGLTRERIRQIEKEALKKMRKIPTL